MAAQTVSFALLQLGVVCFATSVRALILPEIASFSRTSSSSNGSTTLSAPPVYPVACFNPYSTKLTRADVEDCNFIIDEIILRYPNPMTPQTWGYSDAVDIDLRLHDNEKWVYGRCAIFVRNPQKWRVDNFRIVEVASTAQRLVSKCVVDTKYGVGGTASIGSKDGKFYVGLGGYVGSDLMNGAVHALPSVDR